MSNLTFNTLSNSLVTSPVLIMGVQRSGTSLLGNIIAQFDGVEYDYEPWLWCNLPIFDYYKKLHRESVKTLLSGFTNELLSKQI